MFSKKKKKQPLVEPLEIILRLMGGRDAPEEEWFTVFQTRRASSILGYWMPFRDGLYGFQFEDSKFLMIDHEGTGTFEFDVADVTKGGEGQPVLHRVEQLHSATTTYIAYGLIS